MPKFEKLTLPKEGQIITFNKGKPNVPNNPNVPYIRGDGTGVDIWPATQIVLDSAIKKAMEMKEKLIGLKSLQGMKLVNFMEHITTSPKILLKQSNNLV